METEILKVLRLNKAGYSLRQIEKNIGISKSKVQRILKENKEGNNLQMLSQSSQEENRTPSRVSQSVSQPSQDTFGTVKKAHKGLSQEERDRRNAAVQAEIDSENKLKYHEHNYKSQFDIQLQVLLDKKDFTVEDLQEQIDFFTEGKKFVDELVFKVSKITGESENFKFSNFLKELLMYLRKAKTKMDTFTNEELESSYDYKFNINEVLIEYEETEEENTDEEDEDVEKAPAEYETIVTVELWQKYSNTLKSTIQQKIKENSLGLFDEQEDDESYY